MQYSILNRVMKTRVRSKNGAILKNLTSKVNFFLILLFFTTLICNAQNNKKTDWENDRLKGKVKSVKIKVYEPIFKFGEIVKDYEHDIFIDYEDDEGIGIYETYYNITGKITDCKYFYYSGEITGWPIGIKYIYDEKGNNIEQREYSDAINVAMKISEKGAPWSRTLFKYNNDGSIAEKIYDNYYYQDHETTTYSYKYNERGNVIEENQVEINKHLDNEEISIKTKTTYKYDYKGNLIESEWKVDDSDSYGYHKYDSKGNLIEYKNRDDKYVYKYDNKGDLIECVNPNLDGTYEYKYDKKGNWIEKITYEGETKTPTRITERTIEYYE